MFTFGYKTSFSSILRALATIGIGLVMIFDNAASVTVVKVVAAFLLASGIVSLVYGFIRNKRDGVLPLMAVNAVVDLILGILLFLNPVWVAGFIVTLIGIVLILFGGIQLLALAGAMSGVHPQMRAALGRPRCVSPGDAASPADARRSRPPAESVGTRHGPSGVWRRAPRRTGEFRRHPARHRQRSVGDGAGG